MAKFKQEGSEMDGKVWVDSEWISLAPPLAGIQWISENTTNTKG
jgi:hypothetical protein